MSETIPPLAAHRPSARDDLVRERRADVDDRAVALAFEEMRERGVQDEEVAGQVGRELLVPGLEVELVQPAVAADRARVVDDHVQRTEGLGGLVDDALGVLGDVAGDDDDWPPPSAICCATSSSGSRRRPESATAVPSAARASAADAPMPEPAPVTRATRAGGVISDKGSAAYSPRPWRCC